MPSKVKDVRVAGAVTVIKTCEVDMARQVKALLAVLGYTPQTTEGPGVWRPEPSLNQQSNADQAAATASIPSRERRGSD